MGSRAFWALVVVVVGSLLGEILGINQLLGRSWFWFGNQGWEYWTWATPGRLCWPLA